MEARVLAVRDAHPAWGARKIARCLERDGVRPPAVSTVHEILGRHGRIVPPPGGPPAYPRFEKAAPNHLWQMDFKGWVKLADGARCHPLTVIDDHSRYALCLQACADQQGGTVQRPPGDDFPPLRAARAFFVDNGTPWGDPSGAALDQLRRMALKLGVDVLTAGPITRRAAARTNASTARSWPRSSRSTLPRPRRGAARLRSLARGLQPRAAARGARPGGTGAAAIGRARGPCRIAFPPVEYDEHEIVRIVRTTKAYISFKGRLWKVPQAFCGERVAIRPLRARRPIRHLLRPPTRSPTST